MRSVLLGHMLTLCLLRSRERTILKALKRLVGILYNFTPFELAFLLKGKLL